MRPVYIREFLRGLAMPFQIPIAVIANIWSSFHRSSAVFPPTLESPDRNASSTTPSDNSATTTYGVPTVPLPPPPIIYDLPKRPDERWILALDGGGMRGVLTLQALHRFCDRYGKRPYDIFDCFAGTSTGSLIAAGLALGRTPGQLLELYRTKSFRIFEPNRSAAAARAGGYGTALAAGIAVVACATAFFTAGLSLIGAAAIVAVSAAAGFWTGYAVGGSYAAPSVYIPPMYGKQGVRDVLVEEFGDRPLKATERDLIILAHDRIRGATRPFYVFHHETPDGSEPLHTGPWQELEIRRALEPSMSAPVYFEPVERFVDGGVGSYNNPAYLATSLCLRSPDARAPNPQLGGDPLPKYKPGKTRVFSFGTGKDMSRLPFSDPLATVNPPDGDGQPWYWLQKVMDYTFNDASDEQIGVVATELGSSRTDIGDNSAPAVIYYRYQLSLSESGLEALGIGDQYMAHLRTIIEGNELKLDAVNLYEEFRVIGKFWADWLESLGAFDVLGSEIDEESGDIPIPDDSDGYAEAVITALREAIP